MNNTSELDTVVQEELKPCPFCGGNPEFNPYGTCNSIWCEECGIGIEWQVCDVVDNWTQYEFIQTKEYTGYEQKAVDLTRAALTKAWNTRPQEDKALTALNKHIARLDSEELVGKVAKGIHDDNPERRYNPERDTVWEEISGGHSYYTRTAQAAINIIKG